MADTANLGLPYMAASQAGKYVTHNEALRLLDGVVQMAVVSRSLSEPPASPAEGARYIVAAGGSGLWSGWSGSIAMWVDGAWFRILPAFGWMAWVESDGAAMVWTGSVWTPWVDALGLVTRAAAVTVAKGALGYGTGVGVIEQTLSGLSGASVTSTIKIPARSICLGVTTKVSAAVLGATSFSCGISGEASKFGGSLGVAMGSQNIGVIGPIAFYSDTPVVLTASGSNFSGGAVQVAIHYLLCATP